MELARGRKQVEKHVENVFKKIVILFRESNDLCPTNKLDSTAAS